MQVIAIPQLADNYAYLLIDPATGAAAVVDCAQAEPVLAEVASQRVDLQSVLATHHHFDHVGGHQDLLAALPTLRVYGSQADAPRIPGITDRVDDCAPVSVGSIVGRVIGIPAHTNGHVAYHFPTEKLVFTGDTLFVGGCGRLFEGDAAQMKASLDRLAALPGDTRVYCGHEYTQKNLEFALTLEPHNRTLIDKLTRVRTLRQAHQPTIPSTIDEERNTNPFLRTANSDLAASVRAKLPRTAPDAVAVFAAVRALKDQY